MFTHLGDSDAVRLMREEHNQERKGGDKTPGARYFLRLGRTTSPNASNTKSITERSSVNDGKKEVEQDCPSD